VTAEGRGVPDSSSRSDTRAGELTNSAKPRVLREWGTRDAAEYDAEGRDGVPGFEGNGHANPWKETRFRAARDPPAHIC